MDRGQHSLSGPFTLQRSGGEAWVLRCAGQDGPLLYLNGLSREAASLLQDARVAALALEWTATGAVIVVRGPPGGGVLEVRTAILHAPEPTLYAALPLATFDAAARKFWRRVFRIVRLPGGRLLLRVLSRRRGRGAARP